MGQISFHMFRIVYKIDSMTAVLIWSDHFVLIAIHFPIRTDNFIGVKKLNLLASRNLCKSSI